MKLAIITDSHHGVRNSNKLFLDSQEQFYSKVFFPTLKERGIDAILHGGDYFDARKASNIYMLERQRDFFIKPLIESQMAMDIIAGNHDTYFKNTNKVNSLKEHLGEIRNINIHDHHPTTILYDNLEILLCPWITQENHDATMKALEETSATVVIGHFDIKGFEMIKGHKSEHGLSPSIFSRFDMVLSGHFHHKSSSNNIHYLGAPFEFTWNDWNDPRGFHILDTETLELEFVPNPYHMFYKYIYGEDDIPTEGLKDSFVKIVVKDRIEDKKDFDKVMNGVLLQNPYDFQVVDLTQDDVSTLTDEEVKARVKDTPTLMSDYINGLEETPKHLKKDVESLMLQMYKEALSED